MTQKLSVDNTNLDLVKELKLALAKENSNYGKLSLQYILIEFYIRNNLALLFLDSTTSNYKKVEHHYNSIKIQGFATLINYFEIVLVTKLEGLFFEQNIDIFIEDLRKFKRLRNDLVHNVCYKNESVERFTMSMQEVIDLGKNILEHFDTIASSILEYMEEKHPELKNPSK